MLRPASRLSPLLIVVATSLLASCGGGGSEESASGGSRAAGTQPSGQATGAATRPATQPAPDGERPPGPITFAEERHFKNLRMLTQRGENAEAYWSWDSQHLIFQAKRGDQGCDRILVMRADGTDERVIATRGAHTCAFFLPGVDRILYSSTQSGGDDCPPPPDRSQGYVWPLHSHMEIYSAKSDGSDVRRLTSVDGYDAEATVSPSGRVVFTSVRDGDLEIYTMEADGSDVKRLTNAPGYDGGPFYSPDGTKIVYRAWHPEDPKEIEDFQGLVRRGLVRPGRLEIWVMNADGSDQRRVTDLGAAAFAPSFTPDGDRIIFSSNHHAPRSRNFELYVIGVDGTGLERVTWNPTFDGFPMFSPDGTKLAFCSNRGNHADGETNVFVADWVD